MISMAFFFKCTSIYSVNRFFPTHSGAVVTVIVW